MKSHFQALLTTLIFFTSPLSAQNKYPQNYFRYPLPIAPKLNANFGELRPNHYHMGLDLFTERREGLQILAAADGYISRVKIESWGFGRALYVTHSNGYTTLYAHCNNFYPELEKYIQEHQYKNQRWETDLELPAGKFPVKKGQFIAYSGNTGGSQGPHVHFEIRRTSNDDCLNPLLFGFPIADNIPPDITRLSIYDRRQSIYEQVPKTFTPLKTGTGQYEIRETITVTTDQLNFGIQATDRQTGSSNPNGIYEGAVFESNKLLTRFQLDGIPYDKTRFHNAHIDYKTRLSGGPYYQLLYPLPGDPQAIYMKPAVHSYVLKDTAAHTLKVQLKDTDGNKSVLTFKVRMKNKSNIPPAEGWSMHPHSLNIYESNGLQLQIGENGLYDSIRFRHSKAPSRDPASVSEVHTIHSFLVPIHDSMIIRIKPVRSIPESLRDKLVMRKTVKEKKTVQKAIWTQEGVESRFREFGVFEVLVDTIPPVFTLVGWTNGADLSKASRIVVSVSDENQEWNSFRAELDGQWICFSNDKGKSFIYRFDEKCPPGQHQLKLSIRDEAGNLTVKEFRFKR